MQRKRIGERLIDAGLITKEQLEIALEEQKKSGELIGAILYSLGFISRQDLLTVLSMSYGAEEKKDKEEAIYLPDDMEDIVRQSSKALKTAEREADRVTDVSLVPIVRV